MVGFKDIIKYITSTKFNAIVLNILTIFLIIVTIASCDATNDITRLSEELEHKRDLQVLADKISFVKKLSVEIEYNKGQLIEANESILSYKGRVHECINDQLLDAQIQIANNVIDGEETVLLTQLLAYKTQIAIIKSNFMEVCQVSTQHEQNSSIDKTHHNIRVAFDKVWVTGNLFEGIGNLLKYLDTYQKNLEEELAIEKSRK